jgi:hypothetical protein
MSNLQNTFGAWLKVVLPNSGIAERDERLNLIRDHAATVKKQDVLDLVLTFYSLPTNAPSVERLRSAMLAIDMSFGVKDNAELAVIAAGILFEILEEGGDRAATAALVILCADFGALADTNHITEIVAKARQFIGSEGIRVREETLQLPNLGKALNSALEPESEEEDAEEPDVEEEEDEADASLKRVVGALADYGDKMAQSLSSIEARRAEQSDILYWLLSGRRQISGPVLKGLKKEQAVIFVAAEFANLTRQIPGPASASAILSTLLGQCKNPNSDEVTLETCVKSIDATDGASYLSKRTVVHPVITPISFALSKAEENGWNDGWETAFKAQTRKSADSKHSVLKIAEQFYRETLLARALGEN